MAPKFPALLQIAASLPLMLAASNVISQEAPVVVPVDTPLQVQLGKHVPMKKGEPLLCRLMYPVYADNKLVLPAGSTVRGTVVALRPDRSQRIHSRLWGDFTPFHVPIVHFDQLVLPDGRTTEPIITANASDGAPILHLSPPHTQAPRSFIAQQIAAMKQKAKDSAAIVTAPGRKDRLVQFIYKQLPWHPERIESQTAWTVTLAQPLSLSSYSPASKTRADPQSVPRVAPQTTSPVAYAKHSAAPHESSAWQIRAYLKQTISSATEKPGNTFEAVVAEPVFNSDNTLAIPEGSLLVGTITRAKPARSFGRAGKLRFDFRELRLPGAPPEKVMGTLAGADAIKAQQLRIDQEGGVQPESQNRVIVPLVLSLLASRALDDDGNAAGNAAVSSNGFGLVGRIIGIVGGSRNLAAGIGFYAAGLSFSERWLVRGHNVAFSKNTRIEVTTVPARNSLPTPQPQQIPSGRR